MKRVLSLLAAAVTGALATMVVFVTLAPALAQGPAGPQATPEPVGGAYGAGQAARGGWMQQGGARGRWMQRRNGARANGRDGQMANNSLIGAAAAELGITQQEGTRFWFYYRRGRWFIATKRRKNVSDSIARHTLL
ncbi:hypothetical protein A6A03_03525 [Chloroflexus islandicus]|uniref:Uncharacterized protein n=1 Tax=Chloroflexus islandicus TaxID=1707952 RepID=A0A178M3H2_9CHLR|nr:hypothetical protein [Chloroflexus islandicus]OAN42800.1 hypothetical protein A6A03_03525 [Chloroflexus islandicus]